MRNIRDIVKPYASLYKAAKALDMNLGQLVRWYKLGALVDAEGQVWIKTSTPKKGLANGAD